MTDDAQPEAPTDAQPEAQDRPLVSLLLMTYQQERVAAAAVRAALAQTYRPLQIIVSDDASTDGTWESIAQAVRGYDGPHALLLRRNAVNQGITAHLSTLAELARGALLVPAAGDDISLPQRCERLVAHWLAHDRRPDLLASDLVDMDPDGGLHGIIVPPELDACRSLDDWLARRPRVVGAAHAWPRRVFERFGPLLPGAAAEDQSMLVRAVLGGGATTLHEPLVQYRRGGLSGKRRHASVRAMVDRMRRGYRAGLIELAQWQRDAETAGCGDRMRCGLAPKLTREQFIRDMFEAPGLATRLRLVVGGRGVKPGLRLRMLFTTSCPQVYAPLMALKRLRLRLRA